MVRVRAAIELDLLRLAPSPAGLKRVQHLLGQGAHLHGPFEQPGLALAVMVLQAVRFNVKGDAPAGVDLAGRDFPENAGGGGFEVGSPLFGNLALPLLAEAQNGVRFLDCLVPLFAT